MIKRIRYLLITTLLLSSCTHRIVRTEYDIKKSDHEICDVVVKKNSSIADSSGTKIGQIKLGESGLSVACSEGHAINILKGEACAIGADLIIITEELRPNLWSSCYRCSAEFYSLNKSDVIIETKNDSKYSSENIQHRVAQDRSQIQPY